MKATITQTMMTDHKWAIIELFEKENGKLGIFKIRCPFDSKQEATNRAEMISKEAYGEVLELIDETPDITELIKSY